MRRLLRVLLSLAALIALVLGGLYLFDTPNTRPEDGPADPILGLRRPVVGFLRDVGILSNGPVVFFGDPLLPTVGTITYQESTEAPGESEEGVVSGRVTVHREPVWRGLTWIVGKRVTYRDEYLGDERHDLSALRLCHEEDGRREVAGEGTVANGGIDPSGRWASVHGFVPRTATAYWVEFVGSDGNEWTKHRWGN